MFSHFLGFRWKFPGKHGKFQGVTETIVSWLFPGGMEISRGQRNIPGGNTNDTDMVFSRGYGNFHGSMEKPRGPPYFTLDTGCMVLCTHVW